MRGSAVDFLQASMFGRLCSSYDLGKWCSVRNVLARTDTKHQGSRSSRGLEGPQGLLHHALHMRVCYVRLVDTLWDDGILDFRHKLQDITVVDLDAG
jgi:hypothetical protein